MAVFLATGGWVPASGDDHEPVIPVRIEARPSADCFLPSALQQAELEEDFARACPNCRVVEAAGKTGFRVVVEDPGTGWSVSVFDGEDHLLRTFRWHGSLSQGLEATAHLLERFLSAGAAFVRTPDS